MWSRVLSEKIIFFNNIHPIVLYHIQIDIRAAAVHHNKFYHSRQYMLHVAAILINLQVFKYMTFKTQNKMRIFFCT